MNKEEIAYIRQQLENELLFYNECIRLLDKIYITSQNKRAKEVVELIQEHKAIVEHKLQK